MSARKQHVLESKEVRPFARTPAGFEIVPVRYAVKAIIAQEWSKAWERAYREGLARQERERREAPRRGTGEEAADIADA